MRLVTAVELWLKSRSVAKPVLFKGSSPCAVIVGVQRAGTSPDLPSNYMDLQSPELQALVSVQEHAADPGYVLTRR